MMMMQILTDETKSAYFTLLKSKLICAKRIISDSPDMEEMMTAARPSKHAFCHDEKLEERCFSLMTGQSRNPVQVNTPYAM
jgi:hypothetical protein